MTRWNIADGGRWPRRSVLTSAAALAAIATGWPAMAQAYPTKPVRVLVGAGAGGPSDFLARTFSDSATPALGQSFVVDNKAGASGTIAVALAARASADGYTLVASGPSAVVVAPHLFAKLEYDAEKDLTPVAMLGAGAFVLAVHPSLPAHNVTELVALAKAKPGSLSYGSGGNGSSGHLCMEAFAERAGIEMQHVPYKGDAPAANDLLGGQIQLMFTSPNVALAHHKAGKLRIIAVTTRERMGALPEVPAVHEMLKDFEQLGWIMLFAPSATPQPVLDNLATAWAQARDQPAVKTKLDGMGMAPPAHYASRESLLAMLRSERARTAALVKRLGITPA
ncbi:tripartite tricarboxylate transporter substrate binding protein [Comamonadaceae bacterium G21597-S1]|nr:tripartite tricarboxylate transporter substrate binding protein [Comamonadaceae bacterium G21597-S1]